MELFMGRPASRAALILSVSRSRVGCSVVWEPLCSAWLAPLANPAHSGVPMSRRSARPVPAKATKPALRGLSWHQSLERRGQNVLLTIVDSPLCTFVFVYALTAKYQVPGDRFVTT
jgi:hypothetical protein